MNYRRSIPIVTSAVLALTLSAVAYAEPIPTTHTGETELRVNPAPVAPIESPLQTVAAGNAAPSIPEPATAILVGLTLLGAGTMARRRKAAL